MTFKKENDHMASGNDPAGQDSERKAPVAPSLAAGSARSALGAIGIPGMPGEAMSLILWVPPYAMLSRGS